jgi:hypothetical protein
MFYLAKKAFDNGYSVLAVWGQVPSPAGGLLRKLVSLLPQDRQFTITVFGSAPLQITVDSSLTTPAPDFPLLAQVSPETKR